MAFPSQTATKVSTSSIVVAIIVAATGFALLGMAAGLLPGVTQGGYSNLRASIKADKQSIQATGDFLTYVMTIANTGTVKTDDIVALQHFAADTLSFVSAKTTGGFTCSVATGAADIACTGGSLKAGESATLSIGMKLLQNANACGVTGSAMSLMTVDPKNVIAEKNETDNAAKLSIAVPGTCPAVTALPNLTVTNLAVASTNGLVTATLGNAGKADATGSVGIYLYVDGVKTMTYSSTTLKDVAWMTYGNTSSISTSTVDTATVTSVKMCVDALEAVTESDETDNCQEVTLGSSATGTTNAAGTTSSTGTSTQDGTTAGIDLTIKKTGSVPTAKQGEPVSYTILVSNVGTTAATSVGVTDVFTDPFVYASATGTNGFVCALSSYTVVCKGATIGAGSSATITVVGSIGATGLACDTTKTITDVATVDPLKKIAETNEDNNKSTAQTVLTNPCSGSSVTTTTSGGGTVTGGTTTTTTSGTGTTLK